MTAAECAFGVARAEGIVASLQNGLKAPRILRALHDRLLLSGVRERATCLTSAPTSACALHSGSNLCGFVLLQGKPSPLVFMPTSLAAAEEV